MTFEVPKKIKNLDLDVDNDASEQFDHVDDSPVTSIPVETTDEDNTGENNSSDELKKLEKGAHDFIQQHKGKKGADAMLGLNAEQDQDDPKQYLISEEGQLFSQERKLLTKYLRKLDRRRRKSKDRRKKRDLLLERKVNHGGNALNFTGDASNSVSSFENNLLNCYDGKILLAQTFPPSTLCRNVKFLESGSHMVTTHEVSADGYYYYIFYSDNDNVENDINAIFDIHKPTFLYANISESNSCSNSTNCSFPIDFLTSEVVIVEVPTRDGIEHEGDDFTILISTCHPRMAVYVIFPIAVLFLILTCAFI